MRVLTLTPELPYWPGGSGGSTRQFQLLRRLVELGHEVTVVAPATEAQLDRSADLDGAGIRGILRPRPPSRFLEAGSALVRKPALVPLAATAPVVAWQVAVFWQRLRPLAEREARDWKPDVLLVEHDWAAAWARDLPGLPAAITLHNLSWRYYESRAAAASRALRPGLSIERRRFARYDRRHLARYQLAIAVSDGDAGAVRAVAGPPVEVVPNGVDTSALPALAETDHAEPAVLFTGALAYPPNAEGIAWFVKRAWPGVRSAVPAARLYIVGRDPGQELRDLASTAGVELVGHVPDLRPWFERAAVAIAPLLSGGGTRLKALEAMAAARPLVSTRVGVEGLAVRPDRHALVEDDPSAFGAAVVRLLANRQLRKSLGAAGRALVEERYDWRVLGERLAAALDRLPR